MNTTLATLTATAALFTRMGKHYAAGRILTMILTLQTGAK
jgi:hypothetical protein